MKYYLAIEKRNSAICKNMGEPGGHYVMWSKSEKIHTDDLTYMWTLN